MPKARRNSGQKVGPPRSRAPFLSGVPGNIGYRGLLSLRSIEGAFNIRSPWVGGPAGDYTLGVEHLFVRLDRLQLGMYLGGSYGRMLFWGGTSRAVTAGIVGIHRIGSIGSQPLALEGGLGGTRIHSEHDSGNVKRTTNYRPYASGTLRLESEEGQFAYRLGTVFFGEFLVPVLGLRVGL